MELRPGLEGHAETMVEAADTALEVGSGDLRVYATPCLAAIAMFYAMGNWNSYMDCLLYTNQSSLQVLQIYLRNLINSVGAMDSIASTGPESSALTAETVKMTTVAVSVIPILVVYPFLQRFYTKGITVGAVKG